MKLKIFLLTITLAAFAAFLVACGGAANTANNSRANNTTTNLGTNNANVGAVVVNSNATNTNRWSNANVSREEYNKNRAEYEKDRGSSKIGTGANDSWLWFKTRASLLTTGDLRESTIDVDVDNDVVTLRGTVETAAQKTKAEQVAKGIDGVKSVKNELKVAPNDSMTNTSGNSSSNANRK